MDMRIAGSGVIAAGEYEKISVSGSGKLNGFVRCISFSSAGSSSGEEIECKEEFSTSGNSKFTKSVRAGSARVAGSFSCDGDITVEGEMRCAGSTKIQGNIKCGKLTVAGGVTVGGDAEAEIVKISGRFDCEGLLNAEEITIEYSEGMKIGSIGGSKIIIYRETGKKKVLRLPLFSSMVQGRDGSVCVEGDIEGDTIALEGVKAPRVSGRVVAIGADCEIDLVQYTEQIEISPDAKVGKTEKI